MIKAKILHDDIKHSLSVFLHKKHEINQIELDKLNNLSCRLLIGVNSINERRCCEIAYDIKKFTSLYCLLQYPLMKIDFVTIVNNILSAIEIIEHVNLSVKRLLLDTRYVFYDTDMDTIRFVYLPIQYYEQEISIRDFLLELIYQSVFNPDDEHGYLRNFIKIIKNGTAMSMFAVKEYITLMLKQSE